MMKNGRIVVVVALLMLLMAPSPAQGDYEWVTYNGHLYALTNHANWAEAEAEAAGAGGYLAEINDVAENNWLASFVAQNDCGYVANYEDKLAWIGLYYVSGDRYSPTSWRWTWDEPVTYWNPYEYDLAHYSGTHMYLCGSEHPDGARQWGSNKWHDTYEPANLRGIIEVPEPVTLSLLALGGLAVLRKRRN